MKNEGDLILIKILEKRISRLEMAVHQLLIKVEQLEKQNAPNESEG